MTPRWVAPALVVAALAFVAVASVAQVRLALRSAHRQVLLSAALEAGWMALAINRRLPADSSWPDFRSVVDAADAVLGVTHECVEAKPCICPTHTLTPACVGVPPGRKESTGDPNDSSWSDAIAGALIAIAEMSPSNRTANSITMMGPEGAPVAYLVVAADRRLVLAEARRSVRGLLPLMSAALATPLLLSLAIGAAASRANAVLANVRRRQAERERDAALGARALSDGALRNANTTLADLGHEIISPVESLRLTIDELWERARASPETLRVFDQSYLSLTEGYIGRIARAGERVRLALQLQRRHAASMRNADRVNLGSFFSERLQAEQLVGELPYELEVESDGILVTADQGDLEEVVGNLLSNARRFRGGRPIRVTVQAIDGIARITVRNEGAQIPRGEERRIFEHGVALSPATDEHSHGAGLFFVSAAVSAMNGQVYARNDDPPAVTGVSFVIELPLLPQRT